MEDARMNEDGDSKKSIQCWLRFGAIKKVLFLSMW